MSLSSILASYLKEEEKERDPLRLFISDIGKCRRQVAYRLTKTEKDPETEQEKINKTIMFSLAEKIEADLTAALDGTVIASQWDVPMPDRDNWGGRIDIAADYEGARIIEVKTLYPGAFKYDLSLRYPQHHHQARAYDHYCHEELDLNSEPILAYFDRGGQNTPQEVPVALEWASTCQEMGTLDDMRDSLPDIPERLGKVLQLRSWEKQIVLEPDGRCKRPYCKYTNVCRQDMSTSCLAERPSKYDPWQRKKAADKYPELLDDFLSKLANDVLEGK
jgi:hypothetical protein